MAQTFKSMICARNYIGVKYSYTTKFKSRRKMTTKLGVNIKYHTNKEFSFCLEWVLEKH